MSNNIQYRPSTIRENKGGSWAGGWDWGEGRGGAEESFSDALCLQSTHSRVNLSHKQVLVETAAHCQWQNSESSSTMAPMLLQPHNNYVEATSIYSVFNT